MNTWWQHIPEHIDPIVFSIGFFSVRWYALSFLSGIFLIGIWLRRERRFSHWNVSQELLDEVFFFLLIGALIGARLGYVLWYNPEYFIQHLLATVSPFDPVTGRYIGISGMSFHGALLGAAIALFEWASYRKQPLLVWADRIALALPLGIVFGRIGNFLNGELWGRSTDGGWGMYFPLADALLRYPSSLFEAVGEGGILFGVLLLINRWRKLIPGELSGFFLIGYGGTRFLLEYFREPDQGIGYFFGILTLGQIFSVATGLFGCFVWWYSYLTMKKKKNYGILK